MPHEWFNPFMQTVDETSWNGEGYLLKHAYVSSRQLTELFPHWDVADEQGVNSAHRQPARICTCPERGGQQRRVAVSVIIHVARMSAGMRPTAGSWAHFIA